MESVLMELNHTYEYPEELALIDTISDVRISGMARFRYLVASDVKFSLRNISEILAVKENFTKDVKEWQEIELYQSRNLFDMLLFVYDKLYYMSYSMRDMVSSCTEGLTVKDIETLLKHCLEPSFYKKLIKMKAKRLPFAAISTSTLHDCLISLNSRYFIPPFVESFEDLRDCSGGGPRTITYTRIHVFGIKW